MSYEKVRFQWPNAEWTFFIVIYHSSLVKGAMNAARVGDSPIRRVGESFFDYEYLRQFEAKIGTAWNVV